MHLIIFRKYSIVEECIYSYTEQCADIITTQITHVLESSTESFEGLCASKHLTDPFTFFVTKLLQPQLVMWKREPIALTKPL